MSTTAPTLYDPLEDRHGTSSTAGDIRALGVTRSSAHSPSAFGLGRARGSCRAAGYFSTAFRDVVTRCLNPNPQDRPA